MGSPELDRLLQIAAEGDRVVTDDLGRLIVEHALLEGDFLLRSGKRSTWYLDKYRFETRPDLLRALGVRLAEVARDVEPDTIRLAGPALGAVALAASASMASELPFIIVRGEIKEYGTANRIEGPFDGGTSCAFWRTSSRPAELSPNRCRRSGMPASSSVTRCVSWTVRKAGRTPSPGWECGFAPSTGRATSSPDAPLTSSPAPSERPATSSVERPPKRVGKIGMVEPKSPEC